MASLAQQLNRGIEYIKNGRPNEAAKLYRDVLHRYPGNPDALNLLAVATFQLGEPDKAAEYTQRAIRANARVPDYHSNLGRYYFSLGRLAEAVEACERALKLNPDHANAQQNLITALVASGRADEAIAILSKVTESNPLDASAWHRLGTLLSDLQRNNEALAALTKALELEPHLAETHNNYANVLQHLGRAEEALQHYIRAIEIKPEYPDAIGNLGAALQGLGHLDDAEQWYRQALRLQPDSLQAKGNLANLFAARRQYDRAIECFQELVKLHPSSFETWNNLGNALQEVGRYDEALEAFDRVRQINPRSYLVFNNIANNYRRQGQYEKALEYYDLALEANPEFVEAMNNRGVALLDMGRAPEAAPLFERAMALRPSYVDPLINLSNLKRDQGQLEEAARLLSVALNLKPDNAYGWNNLGCSLGDQGRVPEAIACYSKALDLIPENFAAYSNLLLNLHYLPEYSPEQIWSAHLEFANRYRGQVAGLQRPHPNTPDPQRRLRIGYVSADFRRHSVAFFLEPILEWHDRNQFELYCYSDVIRPDAYTGRFQQLTGSGWRDIRGFNHERFAEIVRRDQIDILVDTGGHTANGRILSFAAKPAPVQVSWIGYPDTTGLAEMDYRLTDAVSDPPGQTEQWHSERLWRLEDSFLCYRPAPGPPPVTASPVSAGRPFTFGSFNSMAKVNAAVIQAWASILTAAPGTRMIIKNKALSAPEARERFFAAFAGYGIGPERIELMGLVPSLEEHLASYSQIDLALDTYPYHGTTTTCEALFMGVPVVTLAGRAHVSRVGCTLLHLAGLDMFVAGNEGDYVQLAATLAARWPEWIDLRGQLRGRLQQSPLMDEAGFIRKVESAYRSMWNQWCQGR